MQILISDEEFKSLSEATQSELAALFSTYLGIPSGYLLTSSTNKDDKIDGDEPEELPLKLVKRFMSGVSPKTREVLKLFADLDGETTVKNLENEIDNLHWAGFMSGVTRRLRKMTGDVNAVFFGWDELEDDWKTRKVFISSMTCESLKEYFSV